MTALLTAPKLITNSGLQVLQVDNELEYLKKDFSCCLIDEQNLEHTAFRSVDLSSTLFENTQLLYCAFVHTTMQATTFLNCDLTGTQFYSPEDCKMRFINCQLTGVNLTDLKHKEYILDNCWAYSSLIEKERKVIRL